MNEKDFNKLITEIDKVRSKLDILDVRITYTLGRDFSIENEINLLDVKLDNILKEIEEKTKYE